MTSPYLRQGFPREESLAETYHENTKLRAYMRDATDDPSGAGVELPPTVGLLYDARPAIPLPAPRSLSMPLSEAVSRRRSRRAFAPAPLALEDVATALWHLGGVTQPAGDSSAPALRAAPSAGARYPLEHFLVAHRVEGLPPGVYHYAPEAHALEPVADPEEASGIGTSLFGQTSEAAAHVMIAAMPGRTSAKYRERGYRLVLFEAGHAAQNLLLACEAMGLAATTLGGFVDDELNALARLDGVEENVLYVAAMGHRDGSA